MKKCLFWHFFEVFRPFHLLGDGVLKKCANGKIHASKSPKTNCPLYFFHMTPLSLGTDMLFLSPDIKEPDWDKALSETYCVLGYYKHWHAYALFGTPFSPLCIKIGFEKYFHWILFVFIFRLFISAEMRDLPQHFCCMYAGINHRNFRKV